MADQTEDCELKKKVDALTARDFWISKCPEYTYQHFIQYARKQAGNNYAVALMQLLRIADADAKTMLLYEKIEKLEQRLDSMESLTIEEDKTKDNGRKKVSTFGRRDEDG